MNLCVLKKLLKLVESLPAVRMFKAEEALCLDCIAKEVSLLCWNYES